MKYKRNILKRIGRIIIKHNLLAGNDKVLVALSGGIDSLILLEALAESRKNLPFNIELTAVHIHIGRIGYAADLPFLEGYCNSLSVPLLVRNTTLQESEKSGKGICFLCSWQRRKVLFDLTKELDCNKLAFGHHMDDALETLFLNMVYHGSVSSMPYSIRMFNGRVVVIRPLLEMSKQELDKYAELNNFPAELKTCPHGGPKRRQMGEFINELNRCHKSAAKNIFRSLSNIYPDYLPKYRI